MGSSRGFPETSHIRLRFSNRAVSQNYDTLLEQSVPIFISLASYEVGNKDTSIVSSGKQPFLVL